MANFESARGLAHSNSCAGTIRFARRRENKNDCDYEDEDEGGSR
jgi:hypothetical protein